MTNDSEGADHMQTTDRIVDMVRAIRDLLLIALGVTVMVATPESLQEFGITEPAASCWAGAVLLGALVALIAAITGNLLVEVWACCVVCGGLLLWIIALVWRDDATITSWSVAIVVASTIAGEVVRIADTVGERRATR